MVLHSVMLFSGVFEPHAIEFRARLVYASGEEVKYEGLCTQGRKFRLYSVYKYTIRDSVEGLRLVIPLFGIFGFWPCNAVYTN